ncbi:MAG: hypothetical protein KDE58_38735, partial [Caldilineaceae bacterium]|nr:hypothetical protein [Caldilineaceae bacterium]
MTNLRVAYLLLHFPYLTETFIADEIRALQEQGVDVEIISLLAAGSGPVQPNSQALLPAVWYAPDFHEPALWWAQCAMVGRHPLRYFGLLWRLL